MKISFFSKIVCLLSIASIAYKGVKAQENKPNVILVIVDQYRADASKLNGFGLNTTPFLDSLAKSGAWFNKAYSSTPACVPSRTSMITGRMPNATKVRSNFNIEDAVYETDLLDVFKHNNYTTALIGKNHTYLTASKFDYWNEYNHLKEIKTNDKEEKAFGDYLNSTNFYMSENPAPFPSSMQQPARIIKEGEKWIDKHLRVDAQKPFFLFLSIPEPHNPYQVSEPYYSMFPTEGLPKLNSDTDDYKKKGLKWELQKKMFNMGYGDYEKEIPRIRSNYYGMMRLIDDQIRDLYRYLENNHLNKNTILLFVADHGDYTGEYGFIKKGVGTPEALARIPMIWHGPGIIPDAEPKDAHVSNIDIMPTICSFLNVPIPLGVQGRSLMQILKKERYPKEEFASVMVQNGYGGLYFDSLAEYNPYTKDGTLTKGKKEFDELNTFSQCGMMRMLRKDNFKLTFDMQGNTELYNLAKDPSELKNLNNSKKYSGKKNELLEEMMKWELRMQDPLPIPRPNTRRRYGFKRNIYNYWTGQSGNYINEELK